MRAPEPELMQLTNLETRVAYKVGRERAAYAASRGYHSRHPEAGKTTNAIENHVLGVRAELAVARLLRLPWQPHVGTIEGVDVGRDVEVRCRRMRNDAQWRDGETAISRGMLTLGPRDADKADKAYVLIHAVATDPPDVLRAMGWRLGGDVMLDGWRQRDPDMPEGVYRLPFHELRTIGQLISFLDFRHEQRHDERLARILGRD